MPKGRHLKPDFFTDKHIVSVSPLARLLYQGLWCYAADCGHVEDEPVEFKMRILPADDCDIEELLAELADHGRVQRKDGQIYLPTLSEHARVDKRYETACDRCKARREHAGSGVSKPPKHDVTTTGPRSDHDVTTRADPPNHDADGDGDGDGDGEVMVKAPPRKRAHQLPDDFTPNDTNRRIAAERGVNLRHAFEQFSDHHQAKGSTFKDWHLAFNTWLRNERPSAQPARTATLPDVREVEQPPDGLTDEEYAAWAHKQAQKRRA